MKPGILLLHGICNNRDVFFLPRGRGLGDILSRDFQVFAPELRSGRPPPGQPGWDFDSHLSEEIPPIWEEALRIFGSPPVVLGLSMGGLLVLLAQARGIIKAPTIIALGSPQLFPDVPFYPALMRKVLAVANALGTRRVPIRFLARLVFWFFWKSRSDKDAAGLRLFHHLIRKVGVDVPIETLKQTVAWIDAGRFTDRTGKADYLSELREITVPILAIAGGNDRIAPPATVEPVVRLARSEKKEFVVIPGANHISLCAGDHAAPTAAVVKRWLAAIPEPSTAPR